MSSTTSSLSTNDKDLISRHEVTLTRGSQRSYAVCVKLVTEVGGRIVKTPIDISADEVKLVVVDKETGEVIFEKTSDTPAEITIRSPQTGTDKGFADIHFIAADIENMDPLGCYEFEVWVIIAASGDRDTVIDCSPFNVVERKLPTI